MMMESVLAAVRPWLQARGEAVRAGLAQSSFGASEYIGYIEHEKKKSR